ncbi:hypothetical protein FOZ62_003190, partial [Perkinsus olseni]
GTRPVIMAFIIDSSRPDDMKMYGAFFGLCVVVGQAIGPSIGGALSEVTLSFPFYFVGVLGAILVLLLLFFLTESLKKDENGMPIRKSGGPQVVMAKNKLLWPTVACMAIAAFAGQYIQINWTTVFGLLGSEQYQLTPGQNGGILSIEVLATIAVNIFYVPMARLAEPPLLASLGLFISCLIVVVPFINNLVGVLFLGMAITGGTVCYFAGMAYFSASISLPKRRGLVNSFIMGSANCGGIFGPFAAGSLYDLDPAYPFYLSVVISCLGGLACLGIKVGMNHQRKLNKEAWRDTFVDKKTTSASA